MSKPEVKVGDLVQVWPLEEQKPLLGTVISITKKARPSWNLFERDEKAMKVSVQDVKEPYYEVQLGDGRTKYFRDEIFAEGEMPKNFEVTMSQVMMKDMCHEIDNYHMAEIEAAIDLYEDKEWVKKSFKK